MNIEEKTCGGLSLKVNVAGLTLKYPTMIASGILAVNSSLMAKLCRVYGLGAIVSKSSTYEPREGYQTPVVAGGECYFLNAMGLPNPGYLAMAEELREAIFHAESSGVRILGSIAPSKPEEAAIMAEKFEEAGVHAIELNLSCPHAEKLGIEIGREPKLAREIVEEVTSTVKIPTFVKLGVSDRLVDVARKVEESGASGIVVINTVRGVVIDVNAKRPVLSNVYGGISGPAIRPIAVAAVYTLYGEVGVPIIGCGGVDSWEAAAELMLAGASAVQVGTAVAYKGLDVFREIVEGLREYLEREGFKSVEDIIGLAHNR